MYSYCTVIRHYLIALAVWICICVDECKYTHKHTHTRDLLIVFLQIRTQYIWWKSGYDTYRGWTQTGYLNKHYNINQRTKTHRTTEEKMEGQISFWGYREQESNLILPEHDDDDTFGGKSICSHFSKNASHGYMIWMKDSNKD